MDGLRTGILGGTFDPPHIAHLVLAESAREQLGLHTVLFLPAGEPWRKSGRSISPPADRLAMLKLAIEPPFEISTLEVEKEGPSYTAQTLEDLRRKRPGEEFYFVLGEDALLDLPNWHRPQRIIEQATLAAAKRLQASAGPAELEALMSGLSKHVEWLEMPLMSISGSDMRQRVRQGRSIRYLVPAAVEAYIREQGLYKEA